jgi:hypothetical protein
VGVAVHLFPRFFIEYIEAIEGNSYTDVEKNGHPMSFVGLGMIFTAYSILLLGVLPSDVSVIKIANRLLTIIFAFCFVANMTISVIFVSLYVRSGYTDIPRRNRSIFNLIGAVLILIHVVLIILAGYRSPRERLDQIWRVFASFLFVNGILFGGVAFTGVFPAWVNPGFLGFGTYLAVNGLICGYPNFRVRAQAFLSSRGETRSLAAAVAAAIGNNSVEEAQTKAARLLRYVTLDKISKEELAENKPNPLLYERSVVGKFGEVDAFVSHSWHDPSEDKWTGLQAWRERFKVRHGREPRVWFDKCCIDQLDIDDSLMCLPVHLAACKKFLMIAGSTYVSRMWCIMEIFVFLAAVNDMSRLECIPLRADTTPDTAAEAEAADETKAENDVLEMFRAFTVGNCQCFSNDVRDKLLSIIEAGCGTLESFDSLVRDIDIPFIRDDDASRSSISRGSLLSHISTRRRASSASQAQPNPAAEVPQSSKQTTAAEAAREEGVGNDVTRVTSKSELACSRTSCRDSDEDPAGTFAHDDVALFIEV